MLRIRLRRVGKRGQAYYRVVVADQRAPRDGAFIESLGAYDPHATPPAANLDAERARDWLSKGAQPSEAAEKILRRAGILNGGAAAAAEAPSPEGEAEAPAEAAASESETTDDAADAASAEEAPEAVAAGESAED